MIKKVLLAAKPDKDPEIAEKQLRELRYPVIGSPKIDGIRCHIEPHEEGPLVLSRKNKSIPNEFVREYLSREEYVFFDGELVVGPANSKTCYSRTSSGVMSHDGEPEFKYYVFDEVDASGRLRFEHRYNSVSNRIGRHASGKGRIRLVPHQWLYSYDDLLEFEASVLAKGFEGVMLRSPTGIYKQNRSTWSEAILLKLKRFVDGEARILGFYEQETNNNVARIDETGRTKRSSHKENKVANGHLGGFSVEDLDSGITFNVGNLSGVTKEQRRILFDTFNRDPRAILGKIIKYKHFPIGQVEKPRHPIFLGFRDQIDMGEPNEVSE